jgi:hypothetical protein
MVLAMLQCSVVGEWTGGAVGAGRIKLIGDCKVWGVKGLKLLIYAEFRRSVVSAGVKLTQVPFEI